MVVREEEIEVEDKEREYVQREELKIVEEIENLEINVKGRKEIDIGD